MKGINGGDSSSVYFIGGVTVYITSDFSVPVQEAPFNNNSDFVCFAGSGSCSDLDEEAVYIHISFCSKGDSHAAFRKILSQQRVNLYKTTEGYLQQFYLSTDKEELLWTAAINHDFSRFKYSLCPDSGYAKKNAAIDPYELAISLFLFQHTVISHQGLILHAAGGSVQEKGIAFAAPSGTGKSTLTQLLLQSPHNRLFSEERLIIRSVHEKWHVWGTPWHGEGNIARNESAPLSALVFLRQSQETKITRLSPPDGLRRLLQTASIPWYSEEWTDKGLALCESLIQDISMFELAFRPDQSAVQAVERLAVTL